MPYSADLRCSYFKFQLNIDWYYEAMHDYGLVEIDFEPHPSEPENCNDSVSRSRAIGKSIKEFESMIEKAASDYIEVKAFMNIHHKDWKAISGCDLVWNYLEERTVAFAAENKWVKLTWESDEESDDEYESKKAEIVEEINAVKQSIKTN